MDNKFFWCITTYIGATPLYYCGYYKAYHGREPMPVLSSDFEHALKLHNKQSAEYIFNGMNLGNFADKYKVEEHAYM